MARGGYRMGAGRKRKPVQEKILEGNPGRRDIGILDFENAPDIPEKPPEYFSQRAKEIYAATITWLKNIGCTKGILPYNIEEYAFCKARWMECEEKNTQHGLLVKDQNGKAMPSPFVQMAQSYLKDTNDVWLKIYSVVRESKLKKWEGRQPNDDIMERLLKGKDKM